MIKKLVKFYGSDKDEYGMPVPYYSYLVISSLQQNMINGAVATAISVSQNTPNPNPPHCAYEPKVAGVDAVQGAFNELLNRLGEMNHINNKNLIRDIIDY